MAVRLKVPFHKNRQARELEIDDALVLFSYNEPVAAFDPETETFFKTEKHFSKTTSGHVADWLNMHRVIRPRSLPHEELITLVQRIFNEERQ